MTNFNSATEFFKAFEIGESSKYKNFTPLEDVNVGFSIQREYPGNGRYRPPMRADGTPDVIAIIHVVYNQELPDSTAKCNTLLKNFGRRSVVQTFARSCV